MSSSAKADEQPSVKRMELVNVEWNPKQSPDPTFYSCIRPVQPKGETWSCVKGLCYQVPNLELSAKYQNYQIGKEEFLITSVPHYIPSLLHKPYLTLSLSNPVKIIVPK